MVLSTFFPGSFNAVFISLACKIEFRDLSILLQLIYEEMYVFVDQHEQQVHLKEAEINLIANASKMKKCAAPAQKSKLDLAGSRKFLLLTLMIQPRFISNQHQSHLSAVQSSHFSVYKDSSSLQGERERKMMWFCHLWHAKNIECFLKICSILASKVI